MIPLVVSVIDTFVYERLMSVAFSPGGQLSVVAGGVSVRDPLTNPFLTLNVPAAFTWATVVVFFGSLGTLASPAIARGFSARETYARAVTLPKALPPRGLPVRPVVLPITKCH